MPKQVPKHVHIKFASDSPKAVILWRGPTRWARLLLWDTQQDTVVPGAWFHGRIYETSCSLSPNGQLFAYMASKYHGVKTREVDDVWYAVSKPPWLAALALWPRDETYGGATFADNNTLILDYPHWEKVRCSDRLPSEFTVIPRWIGRNAPDQLLPKIPQSAARFENNEGVDQFGRYFAFKDKQLRRNGGLLFDFNGMAPTPIPPPNEAQEW